MRRKKAKTKRKASKRKSKCHCKKTPSLANMKLATLRTKAKQIEAVIEKKVGHLGVVKRPARMDRTHSSVRVRQMGTVAGKPVFSDNHRLEGGGTY